MRCVKAEKLNPESVKKETDVMPNTLGTDENAKVCRFTDVLTNFKFWPTFYVSIEGLFWLSVFGVGKLKHAGGILVSPRKVSWNSARSSWFHPVCYREVLKLI